jgi:serine protease Do
MRSRLALGAGLLLVVGLLTAAVLTQAPAAADNDDRAIADLQMTGKAFAAVTKNVSPAVVFIKATKQHVMTGDASGFGPGTQMPEELRRFFGDRFSRPQSPSPRPAVGQGSGFIISEDGYILTNNHVAGQAEKLEVTLADGRTFDAEVIGADSQTDVALIKIEADDLPVLRLGNSDDIEVGEWVLAVGSPFGLTGTVTSGIVSAKNRNSMGITDYENFIQTDAAINPGNSGGPLVNLKGEVIGINTAIISRSGGYNGIGFAIPINMGQQICQQLMEHGSVTRGYLGVMIQPLTKDLAKSFGLDDEDGVLVGDVTDDGPAEAAGIRRGDVIVQMNGKPATSVPELRNRIAMVAPGTEIDLVVLRDGQRKNISLNVGQLPAGSTAAAPSTSASSLGLSVQTLTRDLAEQLGLDADDGVVVTRVAPGSEAAKSGIKVGTLIKEVNRKPVKTAGDFSRIVKQLSDKEAVLLLIQEGEHTRFVTIRR